jgi:hypothetical protein
MKAHIWSPVTAKKTTSFATKVVQYFANKFFDNKESLDNVIPHYDLQ